MRRLSIGDAAVVIAVLALIAAGSQAPKIARHAWSRATAPSESVTQRELAAVVYAQAPEMFLNAARIIPRDATYSVVVGDTPPNTADFHELIPFLFQYWLLPRRFTPNPRAADWVISYDHPSETLGVRYSQELGIATAVNIVKVTR